MKPMKKANKGALQKRPKVISQISGVSKTDLIRLFSEVLKLPKSPSFQISELFFTWMNRSGLEWTVLRLKELKTLFVNHLGGNLDYRLPESAGIAFHKSDGSPKGPFRFLWTLLKSEGNAVKALNVLNIYTLVILNKPSIRQQRKFHNAVVGPKPAKVRTLWHSPMDETIRRFHRLWDQVDYDPINQWTSSPSCAVMHYDVYKATLGSNVPKYRGGTFFSDYEGFLKNRNSRSTTFFGAKSVRENEIALADHISDFIIGCPNLARMYLPFFSRELDLYPKSQNVLNQFIYELIFKYELEDLLEPGVQDIVGKISFIQERGAKLRAVANPLRLIQFKLSRLKNWLQAIEKQFPWDCTFDQMKGARWAQKKLREGHKLYSYDLSNATDTIPLSDQLSLLERIGPKQPDFEEDVTFFKNVVKFGMWEYKSTLPEASDLVAWTKGQPLGTACSFGLFALTHGLRLRQLSLDLGLFDSFVVLGDDVIVTEGLSESYYNFVTNQWGCEISLPKSICSTTIAEFASKLVTKEGWLRVYKYRESSERGVRKGLVDVHNLMDCFKRYGKRAIHLVPSKFKVTAQLQSMSPRPFGMGYTWKKKELLIPNHLSLKEYPRLERIPDLMSVKITKRKNARYKSVALVPFNRVESQVEAEVAFTERKRDLAVMLNPKLYDVDPKLDRNQKAVLIVPMKSTGTILIQAGDTVKSESRLPGQGSKLVQKVEPLESIAFDVLHINSNLETDSEYLKGVHRDMLSLTEAASSAGLSRRNSVPVDKIQPTRRDSYKILEMLRRVASDLVMKNYESIFGRPEPPEE